jgi:formamidopyrimidine-DNA glycosylase
LPELPDVEVFRRYLNATSLHQKVQAVHVKHSRVLKGLTRRTLQKRLSSRELEKTARHGKHLFVKVTGNGWLRLHFGMSGFLRYYKNRSRQPEHVRLRLDFSNGYCLAYDNQRLLGQIGWVPRPEKFIKDENLGPDALEDLDFEKFRQLLSGRKASIKSALMDQNAIAGIGNIYSDEILFQAKIHPKAAAKNLVKSKLKTLYEALHQVLQEAIECRADPEKFPGHFLVSHRGEGKRCPRCGGSIKKIKLAGRSGYVCPGCQKPPD